MLKRCLLILLLALAAPAGRADFVDPIVTPDPVAIPAATPAAEVERLIILSGQFRQWQVRQRSPGSVILQLVRTGCSATIQVGYDAHEVRISYLDSEGLNLMTEDGVRKIHPNYNRWMQFLVRDLTAEFAAYSMTR